MKIIYFLFRRSRSTVFLATLAGVISGVSHTVLLALVNSTLAGGSPSPLVILWAFAGLCLLLPASRIVSQVLLAHLAQGAIFDLRRELCRRIVAAPLRHLEEMGIPKLLASLTDDIAMIGAAYTIVPIICTHITVLVACLLYLGYLSWPILLLVLAFLGLGVGGIKLLSGKGMKYIALAREDQDSLFAHFRALTEGIKEMKLHFKRRSAFLSRILQFTATSYRRNNIMGVTYFAGAGSWGQFLFFVLVGAVLFVAPSILSLQNQTIVGSILILLYIVSPLDILSSLVPGLGRAAVALQRVESLGLSLEQKATEQDALGQFGAEASWQSLELDEVAHTYCREGENSKFVLGPINLSFHPGEMVFLVGGNGSGKTTLAKLITGLYNPEVGEIRINGRTITDENRDAYRQHFSTIFTDFFLFDTLLGLENKELDLEAQEYLAKLQLDRNVQVKDGALSTIALSQGQRKRLALLTAYLEDRPIYLFDEWAADQDPLFKDVFYLQILPDLKARGKTVIVISHDDRYYAQADRIIKLDYGKVEYDREVRREADAAVWLKAEMPA